MIQSRYLVPAVAKQKLIHYFRYSTSCQRSPTARTTRNVNVTRCTGIQQQCILSVQSLLQHYNPQLSNKYHHTIFFSSSSSSSSSSSNGTSRRQQSPINSKASLQQSSTSASIESNDDDNNNNKDTLCTSIPTIAMAVEESILKDPSPTATLDNKNAKSTTTEQKPRPLFPWRHDIEPIPRLIPGTREYIEARTDVFQGNPWRFYNDRVFASGFFRLRLWTILFSFNRWKQSLAYDGMYAFTKGVAGIVSNTYRIPVSTLSSEVRSPDIFSLLTDNDDDDVDDDDTTPMIHFHYPPDEKEFDATALTKEFNDEIMSILNEVFNIDELVKRDDKSLETKNQRKESTISDITDDSKLNIDSENHTTKETSKLETVKTLVDSSPSAVSEKPSTDDKIKTPETTSVEETLNSTDASNATTTHSKICETQGKDDTSVSFSENSFKPESGTKMQRHPAFIKPYIPKAYINNKTARASSPNVSNTIESNEDDFCANISDMMIEPLRKLYQSAHTSGRDQLKIKLHMRPIDAELLSIVAFPFMHRISGKEKIMLTKEDSEHRVESIFDLPTTVEIQLWITCLESFQVLDSQTGVVLQGTEDGLPQEVTHIVRFERNMYMGKEGNNDNWKITDIDDMLGHKAWYIH